MMKRIYIREKCLENKAYKHWVYFQKCVSLWTTYHGTYSETSVNHQQTTWPEMPKHLFDLVTCISLQTGKCPIFLNKFHYTHFSFCIANFITGHDFSNSIQIILAYLWPFPPWKFDLTYFPTDPSLPYRSVDREFLFLVEYVTV